MEEIKFNFQDGITEVDRASAYMQWITNRAFQFDKIKYSRVCLHLEDTALSCVAIELCFIIGAYSNLEFYVPRKEARKCRCYMRNNIVKAVSTRKWNKLSQRLDTMCWDVQSANNRFCVENRGAQIYTGINVETITNIAVNLYGWNDNREEYISALKKAIKEAKRNLREEKKEQKKMKREAKKNADNNNQR